jgi:putative flavoprotein involved in K+ transport
MKGGAMVGTETVDVVVVGAGQAGLATSYHLTQQGVEHIILERHRVAHAWRDQRWDSFCLVTPNWTVQLPGFTYDGPDPDGYMKRNEVVTYFERYLESFHPPVRTGLNVDLLDVATSDDRLHLTAGDWTFRARSVVVATGSFQRSKSPTLAGSIAIDITQLHSIAYKNPEQLPSGAVLVVGTGQSGTQIAEELHEAGRAVFLSVGTCGRVPRRYRGKDTVWWGVQGGAFDRTVDSLQSPAEKFACHPHVSGKNGGHDINLRALARSGITLLGRLQSADVGTIRLAPDLQENLRKADEFAENILRQLDEGVGKLGLPLPEDTNPRGIGAEVDREVDPIRELNLREAGITSIVWATGYQPDFSWIHLPVFDAAGLPLQRRGITSQPNVYFVGLEWLHKPKSGLLLGVGEDAAYIASTIASRATSKSHQMEASI